jgi:hypothetical protein
MCGHKLQVGLLPFSASNPLLFLPALQLRARRYKETPLEEFKRRTRERIELRKSVPLQHSWLEQSADAILGTPELRSVLWWALCRNKVVFPTYEEEHGPSEDPKPFDDFFQPDPETLGGYDDTLLVSPC